MYPLVATDFVRSGMSERWQIAQASCSLDVGGSWRISSRSSMQGETNESDDMQLTADGYARSR